MKQHHFVLKESITREEYTNVFREISAFYCLVVRYGTDEYISKMASDGERFEGRQLLKVRPISATFDENNQAKFELKLPIHKTMGTQFKCFAVARSVDRVPAVIAILEKCEHASDVKQSDSYSESGYFFFLINSRSWTPSMPASRTITFSRNSPRPGAGGPARRRARLRHEMPAACGGIRENEGAGGWRGDRQAGNWGRLTLILSWPRSGPRRIKARCGRAAV